MFEINDQPIRREKVRCRYGGILIRRFSNFSPFVINILSSFMGVSGENLKTVMWSRA